jgi:hypothetical protein
MVGGYLIFLKKNTVWASEIIIRITINPKRKNTIPKLKSCLGSGSQKGLVLRGCEVGGGSFTF